MNFKELLQAAIRDPSSVDFTELRMRYAYSTEYSPYDSDAETARQLGKAIHDGDFPLALSLIQKRLRSNYLDIETHMDADYVCRQSGDAKGAAFHHLFVNRLLESIYRSGNGRTYDTAFHMINTSEEYAFLRANQLGLVSQHLLEHRGHRYDVLTVRRGDAADTLDVYFNIDVPKGWLDRQFERM